MIFMNKEIIQTCQKINCEDILNKEFYPTWFFTNERINYFFPKIESNKDIKKVFSVGGGGDFALSLLSSPILDQIDEINICDIRQMAAISIDFKLALLKILEYEEILNLFLKQTPFYKKQIYKRVRETITPFTRKIFDFIIEDCEGDNFLRCLRKSGFWYRDSFWQIKFKQEYLPYLISKEKYQLLQKNLDEITIYCGDFDENLRLFKNGYYDLIYASNVLDSKKYCGDSHLYLRTIKEKLNGRGLLFVITQNNPKKMIKIIEGEGFQIYEEQRHSFNLISALFGHFSYSFLLFRHGGV